jgi:hypothetical protein
MLKQEDDDDEKWSSDWMTGVLLVGTDEASLFAAASELVDGLTLSGPWPFGRDSDAEREREYALRGGALYLATPTRSTVVSDTSSYSKRCRDFVSRCRPEPLLDGSRRVLVAAGICSLPWHVQDAMCKIIDECSGQAVYIVTTLKLSRIRTGIQSRLPLVRVPGSIQSSQPQPQPQPLVLRLTAEQAIKRFQSCNKSMRAITLAVLECIDESERARAVEALAEADHVLSQMDSLCGDGIESTAQQENARRKLVLDAAIEWLKERE